jgi:hypothetical protein
MVKQLLFLFHRAFKGYDPDGYEVNVFVKLGKRKIVYYNDDFKSHIRQ